MNMTQSRFSGMTRAALGFVLPVFFVGLAAPVAAAQPASAASCDQIVARVVSIQGTLELRRSGGQQWDKVARLDTAVCKGDELRTGAGSRAGLLIPPEKFVRLAQNTTLTISLTEQETIVEMLQDDTAQKNACGGTYLITRFPRSFKVRTRYLNAAVEGTEFSVVLSCAAAAVSVFEGKVRTEAAQSSSQPLILTSGQTGGVGADQASVVRLDIKPADAVQWALYYPPLGTGRAHAGQDCEASAPGERESCLLAQAEGQLRVGRLDEAQADIQRILDQLPNSSMANALLSVIAVAKNDKQRALELAQQATRDDPASAQAWIALSYAHQAAFKLEESLAAAQRAAEIAPQSALAQARLAELLMSLGRIRSAERAAQVAVEADPSESRPRTILGFVHLAQLKTTAARENFLAAIERDSADPLPRLGLGLVMIRKGDLVAGREQLEIAVMLDPTNSLLRSYVGKAYYEENTEPRRDLAATQFGLAKSLDPKDPTPWFYDAILKDSLNRPVDSLGDLEKSVALNDNRAVYRSQLLLDQDRASREVNIARAYDQLGLTQPAIAAASSSLTVDPANSSAHRFLSDAYERSPRHEIGRASEVLQSELLQPQVLTPILPSSSFTNLNLLPTTLANPSWIDQQDALLERDGLRVIASGLVGNQETLGDQIVVAGSAGAVSGSLGQFHYQTEGFRENADIQHDLYDGFLQITPTSGLSLQAEARRRDTQNGDIAQNFDPANFFPDNRSKERLDTARVGARLTLSPEATFIGSFTNVEQLTNTDQFFPGGLEVTQDSTQRGFLAEAQTLLKTPYANAVAGVGNYEVNEDTTVRVIPFPGFVLPGPSGTFSRRQSNAYAYFTGTYPKFATWTLGASYDDVSDQQIQFASSGWSPKLGLQLQLSPYAQIRLAGFETMKRALVASQTIEPTQVAGFDQFYDDPNGTKAHRTAAAIDFRTSGRVYFGAEVTRRALEVPLLISTSPQIEDRIEHEHRAYVSWLVTDRWVLSAQVRYDEFERNAIILAQTPLSVRTTSVPLSVRYFDPSGFSAYVAATRVVQDVDRADAAVAPGFGEGHSHFTLVDLGIAYRHPNRHFTLALECLNCTDQQFRYQDDSFRTSSPQTSTTWIVPVRTLLLKGTVNF
ncbi:MAG: hypothetical protein C5B46_09225 [Proteobacteria bacterium]|nr:MAG: hypothetical protein C5B46_09225 [Pseudomonadota bacterium]